MNGPASSLRSDPTPWSLWIGTRGYFQSERVIVFIGMRIGVVEHVLRAERLSEVARAVGEEAEPEALLEVGDEVGGEVGGAWRVGTRVVDMERQVHAAPAVEQVEVLHRPGREHEIPLAAARHMARAPHT